MSIQIGFLEITWLNVIDILLVSALLYNLYKLIKGSVALNIFFGFMLLYFVYLLVKATEMELLTTILGQFMSVGVIAAIILFQQEIRKFLLLIGRTTSFNELRERGIWGVLTFGRSESADLNVTPILDAMKSMSGTNTGALIVISRNDPLASYADTGDLIDAQISKRLLLSIFFKNSPLHDGAALVYKDRIVAARCILPITENPNVPATMGMRHRAGIGMTEVTETVVLIVSEETGQMSFIRSGDIHHNLSLLEIRKLLNDFLHSKEAKDEDPPSTQPEDDNDANAILRQAAEESDKGKMQKA